jgi:hypothetical protein
MLPIPGVQGMHQPEDHGAVSAIGQGSDAPGGVFDDGTGEEDGPVTWETLVSPQERSGESGSR